MEQDLQNLLEADDLAVVLSSKHRPRCIIEFISQGLQLLHLEESKRNLLVNYFLRYFFRMYIIESVLMFLEQSKVFQLSSYHSIRCMFHINLLAWGTGTKTITLLSLLFDICIILQESKISCFHEGIGVCEQLMGIPIPLSYTRLTSRFLVLWHLTLPIILWEDCNWIVVPATFISAASLFCIEEVTTPPPRAHTQSKKKTLRNPPSSNGSLV